MKTRISRKEMKEIREAQAKRDAEREEAIRKNMAKLNEVQKANIEANVEILKSL